MLDLLDGRNYLVMMLENSTTNTIQLCQVQWNKKWLKYEETEPLSKNCNRKRDFCAADVSDHFLKLYFGYVLNLG